MPTPSKRSITAQDLYGIQQISGARIAPDGRHIAYAVQRVEQKTEKKYSNLWIVASGRQQPGAPVYLWRPERQPTRAGRRMGSGSLFFPTAAIRTSPPRFT